VIVFIAANAIAIAFGHGRRSIPGGDNPDLDCCGSAPAAARGARRVITAAMTEAPPEIAAAIRAAFGEAGAGVSLEPLAGGRSGAQLYTFRVGGADYVIRKAGMLALQGAAERARRELECLSIAAGRGVAPTLVYADPARAIVIMARIAGASINRGTPRDGDPLGRLAATLRTLHGGPAFPAGPGPADMVRELDAAARARGAPPVPPSIVRKIDQVAPLVEASGPPAPCHRDLNPTNILATEDRIYLIDWEIAGASHPFLDLAQLGVWVCRDTAEREQLLASYLERPPTAEERRCAQLARVLALAVYSAAFCMVSAFAGRPVGPPAGALDDLFARMARDGLSFAPDEMAATLMAETHREAAAAGLAAAPG
jgi:aminoglycoside phosphotransferase (APT) family kinase protein